MLPCNIVGLDQSLTSTAVHVATHVTDPRALMTDRLPGKKPREQDLSVVHTAHAIRTELKGSKSKSKAHAKKRKPDCAGKLVDGVYHCRDAIDRINWVAASWEGILQQADPLVAPRWVFMEGYAVGSAYGREALGELGGALKLVSRRLGWNIAVCAPMTLKKFVTGKGKGDKNVMMLETFDRWGFKPVTDDDSDAYGLMRLGLVYLLRDQLDLPKYVEECLDALTIYPALPITV